jgi:hypothetical protein
MTKIYNEKFALSVWHWKLEWSLLPWPNQASLWDQAHRTLLCLSSSDMAYHHILSPCWNSELWATLLLLQCKSLTLKDYEVGIGGYMNVVKRLQTSLTFLPTVRSMSAQIPCGFPDGQQFGMTGHHRLGAKITRYCILPSQMPTLQCHETSPGFWFSPWMVRTSKLSAAQGFRDRTW